MESRWVDNFLLLDDLLLLWEHKLDFLVLVIKVGSHVVLPLFKLITLQGSNQDIVFFEDDNSVFWVKDDPNGLIVLDVKVWA